MPVERNLATPRESARDSYRAPLGRALVTGASRRVGRAVAVELARSGLDLALTYRSDREGCEETARRVSDAAREAGYLITPTIAHLDLADISAVVRLQESLAGLDFDAIIHNASVYRATPLEALTSADLEEMYRVEVVAPVLLTKALAGTLGRSSLSGGGSVVFFSDIHALGRARPGFAAYLIAKSAARSAAEVLAVELAPTVRVHCIAPGVVDWPEGFEEAAKAPILARTPLARAGTPDETARLVRFLVLEASYLTGCTIRIDGGRALR